jgi:23S rRNA-/tRNA-specific pseudouridylate synthase
MGEPAILFESPDFLVLDKPPGMLTTSDGAPCLSTWARSRVAGFLHATSRLDRGVSGAVTFARSRGAIAAVEAARAAGAHRRLYLGLVARTPAPSRGRWTGPIGRHRGNPRLRRVAPGGMAAATGYALVAARGPIVVLRLAPETGRTHQLRVHAAHAGVPLLGDGDYGGPRRVALPDGRVLRVRRPMLHASRVALPGGPEVEAPLPDDLVDLAAEAGLDPAAWI